MAVNVRALQGARLSSAARGTRRQALCFARPGTQRPSRRAQLPIFNMISTGTGTTNPALNFGLGKAEEAIYEDRRNRNTDVMTMDGAVAKTGLLLGVAVLSASYVWMQVFSGVAASVLMALNVGKAAGVVGLVTSFATMFKPQWSPITSLIFATAQGLALGAFSSIMELRYPGIVINAAMLVMGTAASLLFAYQAKLINVTDNFRNGVMMVTGGYVFLLMGSWLLSLLGVTLPSFATGGLVGIGVSLLASALAAANLLLDFDMIRQCARQRMPKWFEWYSAFSLMVTLVWFFTEALRLLRMLAGGDRD